MKPTSTELRRLYRTYHDGAIGEMFGVSQRTVCLWRQTYGIARNPSHHYLLRVSKSRLTRLCAVSSDNDVAAMLGVTSRSIWSWRKLYGISPFITSTRAYTFGKRRSNAYALDFTFFSSINTEQKAYALGLLSADGYVDTNGKWVAIALQSRDIQILEDLKRVLGSAAPIKDKRRKVPGYPGSGPQKVLIFSSRELVRDLAKYGVVPRKSHSLTYPTLDPEFDRHFIRGIMDGDGYIGKHQFVVTGTDSLLRGIQRSVSEHLGIVLSIRNPRGYSRLIGYRRDADVLRWIYEGNSICLHRKQRSFVGYWQ
jgi:hypothetical protein